ncbi:MAG: NADH-quinone oxidoreductase subunit N [Bryobacterales bacterium]|nr:NADH-quinone oxidoreductase subunit N [Bryobacteraceae bacterium]MDW8129813.1 NADH-quinone oxidoreductase subunit N [Bryobacterales bacterium]
MTHSFVPTGVELLRLSPEILLVLAGTLLLVLEGLTGAKRGRELGRLALVALGAALLASLAAARQPGLAFSGSISADGFATFFRLVVIAAGLLVALFSGPYLRRESAERGEYYALLLYSVAGQCLMASANELIVLFIALETSSIASYVLAGYLRADRRANEAAVKYFLLGSFASAFLLYGIALIYGEAGSTWLGQIRAALAGPPGSATPLAGAAAAFLFAGFAFKVSAAPFQVWAPDVYQGAPAPVAAFLSAGPKAAAFAGLLRVFMTAFEPVSASWEGIVWVSALATMIVGNLAALLQSNIKRLLAYSSIAHAGYVMVAVTAHSSIGTAAAMFYLAAYVFMNVGAFAVVSYFARQGERYVHVDDLAGLAWRQPVVAALLSLLLLSLIGVPLTGGFFGKFYVFTAALEAGLVWLTVLGLLNSAVAAYYYLRILVVMYMREPSEAAADLAAPPAPVRAALWASALATLILGIFPSTVLEYASKAAALAP